MVLVFETTEQLEFGAIPHIAHESDDSLGQYYLEDEFLKTRKTLSPGGDYTALVWGNEELAIGARITDAGVKSATGTGGYGYYTQKSSGNSTVIYPLVN